MGKNLKYITGFGVIAMCLVLAYFLQFKGILYDNVYGTRRTVVILMLIGYSVYRILRLILAYKKDKLNEKRSDF